MLHPAGLRINLLKLIAFHGDNPRVFIEQNSAGTGRTLVKRNHIGMHGEIASRFLSVYKTAAGRSFPAAAQSIANYLSSTKYSIPPVVPTTIWLP